MSLQTNGLKLIVGVFAATVLAMAAMPAWAGETSLIVHGISKHASDADRNGKPWQERNWGAGLRYAIDDSLSVQAGGYRNSQNHISAYGLVDYTPLQLAGVRVGGSIGVATGYEIAPVVPIAAFVARYQIDRISIAVRYLPPITPKFTSVAAIEIGFRF